MKTANDRLGRPQLRNSSCADLRVFGMLRPTAARNCCQNSDLSVVCERRADTLTTFRLECSPANTNLALKRLAKRQTLSHLRQGPREFGHRCLTTELLPAIQRTANVLDPCLCAIFCVAPSENVLSPRCSACPHPPREPHRSLRNTVQYSSFSQGEVLRIRILVDFRVLTHINRVLSR